MGNWILNTILYSAIFIGTMALVSVIFDWLNKMIMKLMCKFYSTKIGYYFGEYKIIGRTMITLLCAALLIGTLIMCKEMIAYYRR